MAHSLFVGMTEMGKTTLARNMGIAYRSRGFETIVLDPLLDPRWRASYITSDGDKFIAKCKVSQKCMLFVDEGSESVGRYNVPMQWVVTQSRHWGHSAHILCQGATQLAMIVRDQCTHLYLFAAGKRNGTLLAEDFNAPELEMCVSLNVGEYFHAVKGGTCTFHSQQRSYDDAYTSHIARSRFGGNWRGNAVKEEQGKGAKRNGGSDSGRSELGRGTASGDDGDGGD